MNIAKFDSRFATVMVAKIVQENPSTKTFVFDYPLGGLPGQFLMMWLPGIDEKPMSVAFDSGKEFWVTICKVGPFSEAMHGLKVGDRVGIRGPLGTFYEFGKGDHLALVAGGYGAAPMYFVASQAANLGCKVDFILGARSEDLLLYRKQISGLGKNVKLHLATNDGSVGHKGFVTEVLDEVLEGSGKVSAAALSENFGPHVQARTLRSKFSCRLASDTFPEPSMRQGVNKVFTCGPEVMMKAVGDVCDKHGVGAWMSMEKYMKCGVGVCGQCALDDTGDLVCKEGPVMGWDDLKKSPEMGKYHRDAQGKKHSF